jgi:hypothetical protein
MNTGKAIFFGLVLIALAILARDIIKPAISGIMGSGRYMGVSLGDNKFIFVVDTKTGITKYCDLKVGLNSGSVITRCEPWLK